MTMRQPFVFMFTILKERFTVSKLNPKIKKFSQKRGLKILSGQTFTASTNNLLFNVMTEFVDNGEEFCLDVSSGEYINLIKGNVIGTKFLYYSKEQDGDYNCALYIVE